MEIEVRREDVLRELVDLTSEIARDVGIAEVFADHRAVLGFDQGVIVGMPGTRLGERFNVELGEQSDDLMIDVLRPVVGVKRLDLEGESLDEVRQNGDQEAFADVLDGADELELGESHQ